MGVSASKQVPRRGAVRGDRDRPGSFTGPKVREEPALLKGEGKGCQQHPWPGNRKQNKLANDKPSGNSRMPN